VRRPPFTYTLSKAPGESAIEALTISAVDTAVTGYHILEMSGTPTTATVGDRIEQDAASTSIIGIINNLVFVTDSTGFAAGAADVYADSIGTPINFATFDRKLLGTCLANYISDVGITTSSGRVTAWANQGTVGAALNFADPGAAFRPYYNATDANFNNYPSLEFKGATEVNFMGKDSGPGGTPAITAADAFFVARLNNDPPLLVTTEGMPVSAQALNSSQQYPRSTDGVVLMGLFSSAAHTMVDPATSLATTHLSEVISTASEYTWRLNGTQQATTGTNTVAWDRYTYIGFSSETGSKKLDGYLVEWFVYDAKLSANYRTIFEYCAQTRYAIDVDGV
jgi:hypothetical protein